MPLVNFGVKQRTTEATMEGRLCVVTGANSGVGYETALRLARGGAHVVMICRNRQRGEEAKKKIEAHASAPVDLILADLASLDEVRRLARELLDRYPQIHVLVNNAGIHSTTRTTTEDGLETVFAVNHLSPFLLTMLLLKRLKESAPARIIMVNSSGHRFGGLNLNDLYWEKRFYSGLRSYGAAKVANIMITYELADKLKGTGVTVVAAHPGEVKTNIGTRNNGWLYRFIRKMLIDPMLGPASAAGEAMYFLAASPEMEGVSGKYFNMTNEELPFPHARNRSKGHIVWLISEQLTGLVKSEVSI